MGPRVLLGFWLIAVLASPAEGQQHRLPPEQILVAGTRSKDRLTIRNPSGASHSNYPVQIARPFVAGEIAHFPQAAVNGVPVATQADVKSRWPDGSVKHAILSFILPIIGGNASVTVYFQDQQDCHCGPSTRLTKAQMLDPAFDFGASMELTQAGQTITRSARTMLNDDHYTYWTEGSIATTIVLADHTGSYDLGWKRSRTQPTADIGPAATSVNLADASWVRPGDYLVMYQGTVSSFNNRWLYETARACKVEGNTVTFGIAGTLTTGNGVASIQSGDFINAYAVGNTITIDGSDYTVGSQVSPNTARTFRVTGGVPDYPQPVTYSICGTAAARDLPDDSFDEAQTWNTSRYVTGRDQWLPLAQDGSDEQFRSFRPMVYATFWPGLHKVSLRFIGDNTNTQRVQNLDYALVLKVGQSNPQAVRSENIRQNYASRWAFPLAGDVVDGVEGGGWIVGTNRYWIGGAPGQILVDHDLAYLAASKMVENWDPQLGIDVDSSIAASWNRRKTNGHNYGDAGPLAAKYFGGGGLDNRRGLHVSEQIWWLYRQTDPHAAIMAFEEAELLAAAPIHFREGSERRLGATRYFDPQGLTPALGKPITPAGRPRSAYEPTLGYAAVDDDKIIPVGAATVGSRQLPLTSSGSGRAIPGWTPDTTHPPEVNYYPYLVSGDPFYLENLTFLAGYLACGVRWEYRGQDGKVANFAGHVEIRGEAWGTRQWTLLAMAAPDGTPEQASARETLEHILAVAEGVRGITGHYDSLKPQSWNFGASTIRYLNKTSVVADLENAAGTGQMPPLHQWRAVNTDDFTVGAGSAYGMNLFNYVSGMQSFQQGYIASVLYLIDRAGFAAGPLLDWLGEFYGNVMDASKGAPFPYTLEVSSPIRRPDFYSSFEDNLADGWTSLTDPASKLSLTAAEQVFGQKSLAVAVAPATPAYLLRNALKVDKLWRGLALFKLSPGFSMPDGGAIELGRVYNSDGGKLMSAWLTRTAGDIKLQVRLHTPVDRTFYTSAYNLKASVWYGFKLQVNDAHNTYYSTTWSTGLLDPVAAKANAQYALELKSVVQTLPTTAVPSSVCTLRLPAMSSSSDIQVGWPVVFSGTAPAPFQAGTTYYVVTVSASNLVQLSDAPGGTALCAPAGTANYTLAAADPALRNKRAAQMALGILSYEGPQAGYSGTIYFDEAYFLGNDIQYTTWQTFKQAYPATRDQVMTYLYTTSYREKLYQTKTSWDKCTVPDLDFRDIQAPGLAAMYTRNPLVAANYAWFYETVLNCPAVKANPKWGIVPDSYTTPGRVAPPR